MGDATKQLTDLASLTFFMCSALRSRFAAESMAFCFHCSTVSAVSALFLTRSCDDAKVAAEVRRSFH